MSKLIKCKTCEAEIAKNAKTCPHCGAKNKSKGVRSILGTILLIFGIIIIIGALGSGSDEPTISPTENNTNETTNSSAPKDDAFGIGDRVEMSDIYVTLVNVTESNGNEFLKPSEGNIFVICEFTIENESSNDLAVGSMMSFTAYADDYSAQLSIGGISCSEKQQLDGAIAVGKKMNGVVAYEVPADWAEFEIRFTPGIYALKDVIFTYSK